MKRAVLLVAAACIGAGALAQAPNPAPATRAANESPFLEHDAPLSPEPPIAVAKVISFNISDGFLAVQTSLPPMPAQLRSVEGLDAPAKIMVMHRGTAPTPPYTPEHFNLTTTRVHDGVAMQTSIFAITGHTDITRYIIAGENEISIQFIQQQTNTSGEAASLVIQSLAPSSRDQKQRVAAENFTAFMRTHPMHTARFVRPMIESTGRQPALFVVDDSLAAFVFPERFVPTEPQREQIRKLVVELNADDFQARQRATTALEEMGVTAAAELDRLDRSALAPEQATRVEAIISRVRPTYELDPKPLRDDVGFLLDCMLSPNPLVQQIGLTRLAEVTGKPVEFAVGLDDAARTDRVYALREALIPPMLPLSPEAQ